MCFCLFYVFTGGLDEPSSVRGRFEGRNDRFDTRVFLKFRTKERHLLATGVLDRKRSHIE